MVSERILEERRIGLEEAFFVRHNRELLAHLQEKVARETALDGLKQATGIDDETLLQELLDLGLGTETVAALGLAPLVQVAWADGKMEEEERAAVLEAAAASGIDSGSDALALLEGWLVEEPGPEMMEAWADFIGALCANCSDGSRQSLRAVTLGRARAVAEAAGGVLGIGTVARSEQRVLDQLEAAFS